RSGAFVGPAKRSAPSAPLSNCGLAPPLFRELAKRVDLTVLFMMRQTPKGQAASGFGVEFEWDTPLLQGYRHVFANNVATSPSTNRRDGIVLQGHESLLASFHPNA